MSDVRLTENVGKPAPPAVRVVVNVSAAAGFRPAAQELASPGELSFKQSQALLKQRLSRGLRHLFYQLTRLRLHLWWHEPAAELSEAALFQLCPQALRTRKARLSPTCRACLLQRWLPQWTNLRPEKQFIGLCGLTNYYACVSHRGQPVVTLLVQQPTPASRPAKLDFSRAIRLARLIRHDLEGTLQTGQAVPASTLKNVAQGSKPAVSPTSESATRRSYRGTAGLETRDTAGLEACASDSGSARTLKALKQPGSAELAEAQSPPVAGKRRQRLVQNMRDYIHAHYSRPIQLHDLASAMGLNPSYVSFLFSTTLGVTFHQYLEQFRLARAKDLLRDPVRRISEVAYAVGYSNPQHFCNVFSARLGLSPSAWRETRAA